MVTIQEKATSLWVDKEPRMIVMSTMSAWPQQPMHIIQGGNDTKNQENGPVENTSVKQRTQMLTQECALVAIKSLDCYITPDESFH